MLPAPGGFDPELLLSTFEALKRRFNIAGYSIQEYSSRNSEGLELVQPFVEFGLAL